MQLHSVDITGIFFVTLWNGMTDMCVNEMNNYTSRRHADIWSHPGHYVADPYTWPWSANGQSHGHEWPTPNPFVQSHRLSHPEIQLFRGLH